MADATLSRPFAPSHASAISPAQRRRDHRFYTAMSFAIAIAVFAGFHRSYYLKSHFHSPALTWLTHIHGAAFTLWIALYVTQNVLVLLGRTSLHRRLGIASAILAFLLVGLGTSTAMAAVQQGRIAPFPTPAADLAVNFASLLDFAVLFTAGYLTRLRPETHKRLMLLATIGLFHGPAFGRLLHGIGPPTVAASLCFFLAGPVYDLLSRRRSIHPAYRWAVPFLIVTMPLPMAIASSATPWQHLVSRLLA